MNIGHWPILEDLGICLDDGLSLARDSNTANIENSGEENSNENNRNVDNEENTLDYEEDDVTGMDI